ncbi:hypothetical protein KBX08_19040 [Micromonospora sp. H61]|uniref:hypothetical protein n=1 Tax=Micromonospora sp. H61 TaxID=2824888 RepID=UPI001B36D130|nr:hypothetical protein [Micromonospora sp. H61]MBQ0992171.1 hypothetical protein [Micromonospora sp. H61]
MDLKPRWFVQVDASLGFTGLRWPTRYQDLVDNASLDVAKLCGRSRHRVVSVKRGDPAVTTQCASATGRDQ